MLTALSIADIDGLVGARLGSFDLPCPECGPRCRAPSNRARKVLRIWRQERDFATYSCARCGLHGWAGQQQGGFRPFPPSARRTSGVSDEYGSRQVEKAKALWRHRLPPENTPVEAYLRPAADTAGRSRSRLGSCRPRDRITTPQ
jgi:hypothetical protein